MKKLIRTLLVGAAVLAGSPSANAVILKFEAILDGPSWEPDVTVITPGTGSTSVTIDTTLQTMDLHVEFSSLLGNTTASHIHCCTTLPLQGLAGVATTTPAFVGFPLGVTSGVYDIILDLTLASSFNPSFVTANGGVAGAETALINGMLAGTSYLVIHSTFRPAGEIRGFLRQVPEPGTLAILGLGLVALAGMRRRTA